MQNRSALDEQARTVRTYIEGLSDFQIELSDAPWGHMGATLTDGILQSGIKYEVVERRVMNVCDSYPDAKTTTGYSEVLQRLGAREVLRWNGERKPSTLKKVIILFQGEGVETEDDLRKWLDSTQNRDRLKEIKGIGDKTVDYLYMLAGGQGIAIDRYMDEVLRRAGVECRSYQEARAVLDETARLMNVSRSDLDFSIWKYMSARSSKVGEGVCTNRRNSGRRRPAKAKLSFPTPVGVTRLFSGCF